ncbi:Pectate lyase-like protein 4 [Elsinoe fawcettii]|nr:Pectate lyase-like protein 4 [Elsinoe fawcettii]
MKISLFLTTLLPLLVSASPVAQEEDEQRGGGHGGKGGKLDFDLVGFAKDNPIGPTTGGKGGKTTVAETFDALQAAVAGNAKKVVYLKGDITPTARLKVGSNTSLLGFGRGGNLLGNGIDVNGSDNVIIRNLGIRNVLNTDALQIINSTRVWVDHNEFESAGLENGPDFNDGQCDIVRGSNWITVSWNYFHDHWKSSLVGNSDVLREVDTGKLRITYHHNRWEREGTRGPAGRFGRQHVYNNYYNDFYFQAIHSRSDNNVLVEGNVFRGNTSEALSTYGLVIPEDSPNTCVCGDEELDGFANLGAKNDFGTAGVNITRVGNFTKAPYKFKLTPLNRVIADVTRGSGLGKI